MKTFEEIKSDITKFNMRLLTEYQEKLNQPGISEFDQIVANKVVTNAQRNLDNIDEVTTINIGSEVNGLIKQIQYAFSKDGSDYFNQFDKFMEKWVLGEYDKNGNKKPGPAATGYVQSLGITSEDLQCLKGSVPIKYDFGDVLRQRANTVIGTNIPMASVEEKAEHELEAATEENKAQAYVKWMEIQRDSGSLRNGNSYNVLATNQTYQEAKAMLNKDKEKHSEEFSQMIMEGYGNELEENEKGHYM